MKTAIYAVTGALLFITPTTFAFDETVAAQMASLPLKCLQREFPNKPDHVINSTGDAKSPRAFHPAFYGCFDWHSDVHAHWMLVRILRQFPKLKSAKEIREALNTTLTPENVRAEVAYLKQENRKSFERTYGWAWLLKLAEELEGWEDTDGKRWREALAPLAAALSAAYADFLPKQEYAIRTGVHPNTAFGIAFALDYARKVKDTKFEHLLVERARYYFAKDREYPLSIEPGGEDFFSPALMEASLMKRVLPQNEFAKWAKQFFWNFDRAKLSPLLKPAIVGDRSDPKLVHLDGLNLSRAWCFREIGAALGTSSKAGALFSQAADEHTRAALPYVTSGNYEGEHWLATFAVYLFSISP